MSAQQELETLQDILKLVDEDVPLSVIETWSARQRESVEQWASATFYAANDNEVRVPSVPNVIEKYRIIKHAIEMEPFYRFEPPLREILRGLSLVERDALIVLINHRRRELSALAIQRLLDGKPSLPDTRTILGNLVQRNLVTKKTAQSWAGRFQVAPDVMKLVRE